ncbi:MAG: M3 family metallopeptidase [Bacteroidales bacterium]
MKKLLSLMFLTMLAISVTGQITTDNPFFQAYQTPFGVPPFDQIENQHFMPAFEEGMRQQEEAIEHITSNPDSPTFENTIAALDYSGTLLSKVVSVFFNYNSSNTSEEIQQIAQEVSPLLSEHGDNIMLNKELFERVKVIHDQKDKLDLTDEQMRLLEETYKAFTRNGALLSEDKQERFREINQQLALLTLQFGQNVLQEVNNYMMVIENQEELAGLPEPIIEAAATLASNEGMEGKWAFTLHNPSVMPFLHNADNRERRQQLQQAYINRGNNDNEYNNQKNISQIANLRLERARMLGYDNHAHFVLEETMAGNIDRVMEFIDQVWEPGLALARKEAEELQALIDQEGHDFDLAQWDWRYYAQKVRQQKYDLDEEEVRQYFELNTVRDGIFMVVDQLWGLQFIERNDIPKYHPDAQVFEVQEKDGSHIGILYMDFFPRESKRGGAWMSSYRNQHVKPDGEFVPPVITLVCNFTPPSESLPSLLTFDEMTTFFHEFGHALHGLLSRVNYPSLSGTNVPRDFVELPSQIMENWAREPEVMKSFAKHYETGEPIPEELMEKIAASGNFNQGFETVEFLGSTYLDMEYHTINEPFPEDKQGEIAYMVEDETIADINLMPEIYFRHGSTHFNHIFSGGYSAGYYSYMWSGLLDADAFEAFREAGDFFDQTTAESFRRNILQMGGTQDAMQMYIRFRGQEPKIEPLLRQRGLTP